MEIRVAILVSVCALIVSLSGCGGGGGDGGGAALGATPAPISSGTSYVAGTYMPSGQFKGQCAAPRAGNINDHPGSVLAEQLWLRSWSNELYLWFNEITDTNPAGYTVASYFDTLKTTALTSTGKPKDKFHFTYPTDVWEALSQSGVDVGYGAEWALVSGTSSSPRKAFVAFLDPGYPVSAANTANLTRGAEVLSVDGASVASGSVDVLNAGLFPSAAGETHSFTILDRGATLPRTVALVSSSITSTPVQNVTTVSSNGAVVGYMQFNDHIATAESQLIAAVNQLKNANVNDLVLDIRYNGGGYLDIASELAYMIAGSVRTSGRTFERQQFNSKVTTINPVTGQPLVPTPFYSKTPGIYGGLNAGQTLPTLNLSTVYVLTSASTCSASEAIINGLVGVGVSVVQIGSTTCGKPYGFYPQDNCGTTYFTIEFKGVNDANAGDYTDGFSPRNSTTPTSAVLPGCSVADDFIHALGDPAEARFATALNYRISGAAACPAASGLGPKSMPTSVSGTGENAGNIAVWTRPPMYENRWRR